MRLPRLLDGLAFRIGLLLTVALFPIGLIAISLTSDIARSATVREEGAILALTAEAAAGEEALLAGARSVARAIVTSLPVVLRDTAFDCNDLFQAFVEGGGEYAFAGFINKDGIVRCGSDLRGVDVSTLDITLAMVKAPSSRIDLRLHSLITGEAVIVMQEPAYDIDKAYMGYVALAVPVDHNTRRFKQYPASRELTFMTFNAEGKILAANGPYDEVPDLLPQGHALVDFIGGPRESFTGTSVSGEPRAYAVVPILGKQLYALGSWPLASGALAKSEVISPLLFVSMMWLVSLGVAYLAVHRMAIRNIADLRARMSLFIATRRITRSTESDQGKPLEFREITRTWEDLAETVIHEEAELENIIHGRTVLLKEVHHRVKNNLQLISSIVSMKIRRATTPEARNALKEVQMRVSSISTVHLALYNTSSDALVEANELLETIVSKTIEANMQGAGGFRVETSWDKVSLYPDQAVPLSLLASEAVSNALKYVGKPVSGFPWLKVELKRLEGGAAELVVSNSKGAPLQGAEPVRGTGLGLNLMRAFALQMRGSVTIEQDRPDAFVVRAELHSVPFSAAPIEGGLSEDPDWEDDRAGAGKGTKPPTLSKSA